MIRICDCCDRRRVPLLRHSCRKPSSVIPGARIVLAMTLGYTSMDRIVSRKERVATTNHLCGGPTGLPVATTKPSPAARKGV